MSKQPSPPKSKNYVNNKDLLEEIALSKNTYCWFEDPTRTHYHAIVTNTEDITPELLQELVKTHGIHVSEVIIREITYMHIPKDPNPDPDRRRSAEAVPFLYTNFKPFRHWSVNPNGTLREVARSHWTGSIHNGHFSIDHGKVTNNLGKMWYLLTSRIATKSNWRNYSYNDEMIGNALVNLMKDGLKFDEHRSANPFAYFSVIINTSFTRTLNIEKKLQEHRQETMSLHGYNQTHSFEADQDIERYYRITEYENGTKRNEEE